MKKMIFVSVLIIFTLIYLCTSVIVFADTTEKKKEKLVKLNANMLNYNKDKDLLIATGNVKITQEDVTITAGRGEFYMKNKTGLITGNVVLTKKEIVITGDKMDTDFNKKIYKFQGNVMLVQNRKNKKGEEDKVIWYCKALTINGDSKDLQVEGGVKITKKDLKIDADSAHYMDKDQTILLAGNVYIDQNNGEKWMKGDKATIYLKSEDFDVEGNVTSGFKLGD